MAWQIENPHFEVVEIDDGWFGWILWNRGSVVAESTGWFDSEEIVAYLRWLTSAGDLPIRLGARPKQTAAHSESELPDTPSSVDPPRK